MSGHIAHRHIGGHCPETLNTHAWCPAQKGDSRSPCPALNALANHGYLPRDGKKLGPFTIVDGLVKGYNLSRPFAWFLTIGGYLLLKQFGLLSLSDLSRHNGVEHDASLVHRNTCFEDEYAPIQVDDTLFDELCVDARTVGTNGVRCLSVEDTARARVRREKQSLKSFPPLDGVHAEIAKGEMAIALGVFVQPGHEENGIPLEWVKQWFLEERIPTGWKSTHSQGIIQTILTSWRIKKAMEAMKKADDEREDEVEEYEHSEGDRSSTLDDPLSARDSIFSAMDASRQSTPPTESDDDANEEEKKPYLEEY